MTQPPHWVVCRTPSVNIKHCLSRRYWHSSTRAPHDDIDSWGGVYLFMVAQIVPYFVLPIYDQPVLSKHTQVLLWPYRYIFPKKACLTLSRDIQHRASHFHCLAHFEIGVHRFWRTSKIISSQWVFLIPVHLYVSYPSEWNRWNLDNSTLCHLKR